MASPGFALGPGRSSPLGVTLEDGGANVAVAAPSATSVAVCLYDGNDEVARFTLMPGDGDIHCGFIAGMRAGQLYGLRADGPHDGEKGLLFDSSKLLVDPRATRIDGPFAWHSALARRGEETSALVPRAIAGTPLPPAPLKAARKPGTIYEINVRAFTRLHPDVPEEQRGTVAALGSKPVISYLQSLGIDTVELMPLAAWIDERHLPPLGLANAWGYNPVCFMAPDPRLAPGGMADIRAAVDRLHEAGFQVLIDVVFNHTGESDLEGTTLSLRGLGNSAYYAMDHGRPINDTGCGNTLDLSNAHCLRLVMDSLRHWASQAGVDGFRYDLATVLGRGPDGFSPHAPFFSALAQDPVLAGLLHIAEPWDIGPGGYQLGQFPAPWMEWNDRYRDDVRHFWRGDSHALGNLATRLAGSSDLFSTTGRTPAASVNYVAAHDGFTLADVVRFSSKDNFANGENNRDGNSYEASWVADDPARDARALLATLFLSRGTPMLTAGDEFGRSQNGNNNAYAQDNETTWLDWAAGDTGLKTFTADLVAFRAAHLAYFTGGFLTGSGQGAHNLPDAQWFNGQGSGMTESEWSDPQGGTLILCLSHRDDPARLAIVLQRGHDACDLSLPEAQAGFRWEIAAPCFREGGRLDGGRLTLAARSVVALKETALQGKHSMASDQMVKQLAEAAGIDARWWDIAGRETWVPVATLRHHLTAMEIDHGTARSALASLAALRHAAAFPAVQMIRPHEVSAIRLDDAASGHRRRHLSLRLETGEEIPVLRPGGEAMVSLPPLPPGLHGLVDPDKPEQSLGIACLPGSCYQPDLLSEGSRSFGIGTHLYALRDGRDSGIGDFTTLARFAERAARLGAVFAGINPLHHMFPEDRERASAYQPSDRRLIDPIYIDVTPFGGKAAEAAARKLRELPLVDYSAVWAFKEKILRTAWKAARTPAEDKSFKAFVARGGAALEAHARHALPGEPGFALWLQWVADAQFAAAAEAAHRAGLTLGIYRDLALGCAYEGGEVASDPGLFATGVSIGSPPDPFSAAGQVWNLPPMIPQRLAERHFRPWQALLEANMRHAGLLRIDHVLGLQRQFWVPRGAEGRDGAYVAQPLPLLAGIVALESQRARCAVIGEDLGTVPDGLRAMMGQTGMLSCTMMWFERNGDQFTPPRDYPARSLVALSSHDLTPFHGWQATAPASEKAALNDAADDAGSGAGDLIVRAHAMVASSPAALMQVQADDLTAEQLPLNRPGTDREYPNWRRRLSQTVENIGTTDEATAILSAVRAARPELR